MHLRSRLSVVFLLALLSCMSLTHTLAQGQKTLYIIKENLDNIEAMYVAKVDLDNPDTSFSFLIRFRERENAKRIMFVKETIRGHGKEKDSIHNEASIFAQFIHDLKTGWKELGVANTELNIRRDHYIIEKDYVNHNTFMLYNSERSASAIIEKPKLEFLITLLQRIRFGSPKLEPVRPFP